MGIVDKAKQAAIAATVTKALDYLEKDPETNIPKIMEMVDKVTPDGWYAGQRNAIRHSIEAKDNWYQLILRMYQLDAGVRQTFFRNFIVNASLKGSATQEKVSEENDCNVPWAILLDPTSACNLHCTGCWAAEYGHKLNLDLETIDSIVKQGKELGTVSCDLSGRSLLHDFRQRSRSHCCPVYGNGLSRSGTSLQCGACQISGGSTSAGKNSSSSQREQR